MFHPVVQVHRPEKAGMQGVSARHGGQPRRGSITERLQAFELHL